ncbi:AIR synthase-related protein [Candidatus Pyrohabitans sp.]
MDLEGFVRRRLLAGCDNAEAADALAERISEFKNWSREQRLRFAGAVVEEVRSSLGYLELEDGFLKELLGYASAGVSMGEFGVGSRGEGDFFVHRRLAQIVGSTSAVIGPGEQDDAGVIKGEAGYITVAVDGMHSRLSEFPFLAGFHAARAALRDVCVMGSKPRALISDLHLADDGDVGKLFDFTAGVACVGELCSAPLIAGSTLRVGGDMVFGERLVASVAAVGTSDEPPKARRNAEPGDVILLTEGRGGGTVTTIAIYHRRYDVVKETLNVEFMKACEVLIRRGLLGEVHTMSDVTNGGVRGDAWEISRTAGRKLVFFEDELYRSINARVLRMLQELEIDPLGISTDSLMLILPEEAASRVKEALRGVAKVYEAGRVEVGRGVYIAADGGERELGRRFREAAYTKVKKVVGEEEPGDMEKMKRRIEEAAARAVRKKLAVKRFIQEELR